MKNYVKFFETRTTKFNTKTMQFEDVQPYQIEAMGSDSVFILDGRNKLETMIDDSFWRMGQLKNVQNYTGFQIHSGNLKQSKVIYSYNTK